MRLKAFIRDKSCSNEEINYWLVLQLEWCFRAFRNTFFQKTCGLNGIISNYINLT